MIDAYDAVRYGRIDDPNTIRDIAQRFLNIARDPEASKNFPFDAELAARTLLQRAKWCQDQEIKLKNLIDVYDAVRDGHITDPELIRYLAQRFMNIARDLEANYYFPFDAERAARILFQRAKWYEDQANASVYDANTQADMPRRRRANDNLMAGG